MVTFKTVTPYRAIKEIYKHKRAWKFLYNAIEYSNEIIEEDGEIYFDDTHDKLYYINDKDYLWIAGYSDKKLCFFQLIKKPTKNSIELVIAQKKNKSETKNWFNNVLEYVKSLYPGIKSIVTFPMNDTLKNYYKKFGFIEHKTELKLKLK